MALENFERIDDFGDPVAEAHSCRSDCALFDFSFLECVRIEGGGARGVVEMFVGRSLQALDVGKICYAIRVGPTGDTLADLTVWRIGPAAYEVMSGRRDDVAELLSNARPGIETSDRGAETATFALQGPGSITALRQLADVRSIESLAYFGFGSTEIAGIACRIGRLGYTGEPGFEIITRRESADDLWRALSTVARPAGFVAMDMLRIEAGFVLFANDFRMPVSPAEAGLAKFHGLADRRTPGIALVSFCAEGDGLSWPWQPPPVLRRPSAVGEIVVTSACNSVVAGGILGLGYVRCGAETGASLADPTGIFRNIRQVPRPFYDPMKLRPRAPWQS
jgi:glycine cleavage system aminomethyltransferase T